MPQSLDIYEFLFRSANNKNIIDVRSPGEYIQGHIPGAINFPLFSNEERAEIGTLYKQQGRQQAVIRGMEIVGPRMKELVIKASAVAQNNALFVHCWRGGMRSGFVAMLLEMYGLKVFILKGGYKKFRGITSEIFSEQRNVLILGGKTGSGKTNILQHLKTAGQQVIDLEAIASHKGSAFGGLGEKEQPTQEQFENELAIRLKNSDPLKPLWFEDESRLIGKKIIPAALWEKIREAKLMNIDLPFALRLTNIVNTYGKFSPVELETSLLKISKRIGPEQTKNAILALRSGDVKTAFEYCLYYYDKTYAYGLSTREKQTIIEFTFDQYDPENICKTILNKITLNSNGRD